MSDNYDNNLRRLIEPELAPNEQIIWIGKPVPRVFALETLPVLLRSGFFIACVLAVVGYFVLSWTEERRFTFWFPKGVPIEVGIGLFVLTYAGWGGIGLMWAYREGRQRVYTMTSQRVGIILDAPKPVYGWYFSGDIEADKLQVREKSAGVGDLILTKQAQFITPGAAERMWAALVESPPTYIPYEVGFFGIPEVHRVAQIARETFTKARR